MKHLLLWSAIFVGSSLLSSPRVQAASIPADTIAGQARFVKLMSTSMCNRLGQESQKADLSTLSPTESEALLKKIMLGSMGDNFAEFSALLEKTSKGKAEIVGRDIGEQAVLELMKSCPKAAPLLAKAGSNHVSGGIEITPAERGVLLPITQDACQRLEAENAKQPLDQRTPAQRTAVLQQVMQGVFMSHSDALEQQYGEEVMQDASQAETVGKKMGLLMVELCPTCIMQAGRDHLASQREAASAAKPRATTPAAKPPGKAKVPAAKVR